MPQQNMSIYRISRPITLNLFRSYLRTVEVEVFGKEAQTFQEVGLKDKILVQTRDHGDVISPPIYTISVEFIMEMLPFIILSLIK